MKKMKFFYVIMAMLMWSSLLVSCSQNVPTVPSSDTQGQSSPSSEQPKEVIINPLTGEAGFDEALLSVRPVAVMINNIAQSLPQRGIADADIVYEMPVEGPITRLMAVFADYKSMPDIGSIRSARHDYVELVKPINAFYLHFGGSDAGKQAIANNKIDDIEGLYMSGVAFYKDKERARTKSIEHCWFSNGKLLQAGIAKKEYDTATEPLKPLFNFAKPEEDVMEQNTDAKTAVTVIAPLTNSNEAEFTYDEAAKTYSKNQNGKPHLDTNKNESVKSTNIFIMYTDVGYLSDNYHKEIDMSKGTGYYISRGKAVEVTFKKASVNDTIKVYAKDGKEIKVNAGKTYFCVADNSKKEKLDIK